MKRLLLIIPASLILLGLYSNKIFNQEQQQPVEKYDYSEAWIKVQNFENKGLPESALKIVNEIYVQAKAEEEHSQFVKAVIHILRLTHYKEESPAVKNLDRLRKETETAVFPVKPLLYSMLAEGYWSYYEQNRWRFGQRSETVEFKNDDISTWSLEKIVEEVLKNYSLSLEDSDRSKKIKIDIYDDILNFGNTIGRSYRPTLYDFLAHRAVDHFTSQEPDITKPAYAFTINSPDYLADARRFSMLQITTKDTMAHKYHALKIFQELIRLHLDDPTPDALVDVDLKRLAFINNHMVLPQKQDLYRAALENLEQRTISFPVSTIVTATIAQVWIAKGTEYKPQQSAEHQWDVKKAFDICNAAIERFPGSSGAIMCQNLQEQIRNKSISVTIEKVNIPEKPFRALVEYQNFSKLYWRTIRVTRDEVNAQREKWRRNYDVDPEEKFLEYFLERTYSRSGVVTLPDLKDYQRHSAEIKIDGMPAGDYMVLVSFNPDFTIGSNNLNYAFTTVSDLSYVHRNFNDGSSEFCILNRTSGLPVAGAEARLFFTVYNSFLGKYVKVKSEVFTSDAGGFIKVPYQYKRYKDSYYNSFTVDFSWKGDHLSTCDIDENYYNRGQISQYQQYSRRKQTQTLFFLDRAIYRPGQTLYYKGLVYQSDGKNPVILPGNSFTVTFYDVNSQVVARQDVKTNEYGTFSGTFTTPSNGLMGQMNLEINDGYHSRIAFSVEEYKRPKFEVKFEPVKGTFKLGETIKATGKAIAYSGANIDGAKVQYRVVRKARFPFWWWCWYGYYPVSPEMEIVSGVSETDAEGKFSIDFKAIPDESVNPKSDPVFNYTVYADVTDINGETHSGQSTISVGYKALELGVEINDTDLADEGLMKKKFAISATNLAGEPEPVETDIKIWRLNSPDKAYRERLWHQPDQYVLSEEEFRRLFPEDPYADESNYFKWEKGKEVFSMQVNTRNTSDFTIKNLNTWKPGMYQVEISANDKFGKAVREVAYFEVYSTKSREPSYAVIHRLRGVKTSGEPGENAVIQVESSESISALYEIEQEGKILERQRINLSDEGHVFNIPIVEAYRGNIAVHYTFVKNSRLYTQTETITVPFTNKELDIKFESFRDKLQPGEQEQWKIKVSGKKAGKVMVEMVATLYDQSLDVFRANNWYASFYSAINAQLMWQSYNGFEQEKFRNYDRAWNDSRYLSYNHPEYDKLEWFGFGYYNYYEMDALEELVVVGYGTADDSAPVSSKRTTYDKTGVLMSADMSMAAPVAEIAKSKNGEEAPALPENKAGESQVDMGDVKIRSNFNETAFFYPHLQTNEDGDIIISFTVPEALTRWKMLGFAHTKELQSGSIINELVTQKELMVVPNQPRFFRENDKMIFSAKITSLAEKDLTGTVQLEFLDALTMKPVDALMKNNQKQKPFSLKAKQSTAVEWSIEIPEGVQAIMYRIAAKAGDFSDGEEMVIPVVTNSMLVTETMPLPIRGKETKTFRLDKLADNSSSTLRNHRFTLEFTSNPAWYAVQALPYMMEYPYECSEQTFSRFYANSIATHIANSNPKIKKVFDTWATIQPDALLSNLEKNQELKSALLEETPWVLNAKSESQRKRNVALLFNLHRMANEQERALKKIMKAQTGNGGFSWFPGLPDDRYITQHIVAGLGHLDVMGVKEVKSENRTWQMVKKAVNYMDAQMQDHYRRLRAQADKGLIDLNDNHLDYMEIHYLYTRSYFKDIPVPVSCKPGFDYFLGQAKKYWLQNSIYMQGMITLALHRYGDAAKASEIVASLSERALHSEEMGMYWRYDRGYYWYQAPIETQSLLIEVFDEVAGDRKAVEDQKVWLLKQKQVQDWRTTKATSEACYALLRRGANLLASDTLVQVVIGGEVIDPFKSENGVEAGTGYFKTAWTAEEITPNMGKITVTKKDEGIAWGAVYWQYFEQLDKITAAETPLQLKKQLFLEKNTDRGPVITPVTESTKLHVGDLIKVRIELRVDRTMEYIHMKDMRASAFEPVETLSSYKYQDGLYYYQSPRDLAVNFFIGWLLKGTYVFEYPLRVSQKGDFSNGITTIQCMYAPEFSSHSEGIRVKVE